jgi:polyisoprenyl-phosphate glycosyltransferase
VSSSASLLDYLRGERRIRTSWRRWAFYRILNTISQTRLDSQALREFVVSRRALNGILRNRSRSRFLNEAFFASGYSAKPLDVSMQVSMRRRSRSEESRLAWGALTRMTNFPIQIGQWSIALMLLGCAAAIANALTVRFFQHDIFWQPEVYVPGWAFIVILVSGGLMITNIAIYAVLRMLYVILDETKTEPRASLREAPVTD